jgi:DNA topoisomerase-3
VAQAEVEEIAEKTVREPPPLLFDLGALQRTANRRFGYSAEQTLKLAQSLYEKHKLITYPRTDSRYLSNDLQAGLPRLFAALAHSPLYAPFVRPLLGDKAPRVAGRRIFADHKVSDHHAIIPTAVEVTAARVASLSEGERRIFDLIARRFIAAFYPDAEFRDTQVRLRVAAAAAAAVRPALSLAGATPAGDRSEPLAVLPPPPDRYQARGRVRIASGWQEVAGFGDAPARRADPGQAKPVRKVEAEQPPPGEPDSDVDPDSDEGREQILPALQVGQRLPATFQRQDKQTRPPPRYSEATLLSAMEGAGQKLDDEALRQAMRDHGLGTPATRAAIIETLLARGYIARHGKQLVPTALGSELIHSLPVPALASAELTGRWEARLSQMARGEQSATSFMRDIRSFVAELVARVQGAPVPIAPLPALGSSGRGAPRDAAEGSESSQRRRRTRQSATPQAGETAPRGRARSRRSDSPAGSRKVRRAATSDGASRREPRREASSRRSRRPAQAGLASPPSLPVAQSPVTQSPVAQSPVALSDASRARPAPGSGSIGRTSVAVSPVALGSTSPGSAVTPALPCPRCREGVLLWGKRGWGCSQFHSCPLVLPFVIAEQRLTLADLRLLCSGQPLYLASPGKTLVIRLLPGRSEAPFLVTV